MNYTESEEKKKKLYGYINEIYRDDQENKVFFGKIHPFLRIINTFKENAGYPIGLFVYPLSFSVDLSDEDGKLLDKRIECCFMYLNDSKRLKITEGNFVEIDGSYTDKSEKHFYVKTLLNTETQRKHRNQLCISNKAYKYFILPVSLIGILFVVYTDSVPFVVSETGWLILIITSIIHYPLILLWLPLFLLFLFFGSSSSDR